MEKRDKLFKKCYLHVDKDNYKEARNEVQKLICTKKKAYFENKLTENIWKSIINCLENDKSANFDVKDIVKDFSTYFLNFLKILGPSFQSFIWCAFSSSILQPFRAE